jgi:hypothetical protein
MKTRMDMPALRWGKRESSGIQAADIVAEAPTYMAMAGQVQQKQGDSQ